MDPYRTPALVLERPPRPLTMVPWIVAAIVVMYGGLFTVFLAARTADAVAGGRARSCPPARGEVPPAPPAVLAPAAEAARPRLHLRPLDLAPSRVRATAAPSSESPIPWPPALVAASGPPEHRGAALLARARRLAAAGLDLRVFESTVYPADLALASQRGDLLGTRYFIPYEHDGQQVGVAILAVDDGSLLDRAGFQLGDVVTSIDGHALTRADREQFFSDRMAPGDRGVVTVEVLRRGARVVLGIHWSR